MSKGRLEAFSDGVIAIIITIMVLELKVPHGDHVRDLAPLVPTFLSYVLSFVYVGIYWNNHHHMLHAVTSVTGAMLWANLHLLFWLSLFPFTTGWMGENHFTALPTAVYGVVLLMAAIAYLLLQQAIIRAQGPDSILKKAVGHDWKGKLSPGLYVTAIVVTLRSPSLAQAILVAAALIWLIPDRRIEKRLANAARVEKTPATNPKKPSLESGAHE
jgi:TMEM175 potassium channel family protein